jgi:hypothetical protein
LECEYIARGRNLILQTDFPSKLKLTLLSPPKSESDQLDFVFYVIGILKYPFKNLVVGTEEAKAYQLKSLKGEYLVRYFTFKSHLTVWCAPVIDYNQ